MQKKYDINDYFIGELYISERINNLFEYGIDVEQAAKKDLKKVMNSSNAIKIDKIIDQDRKIDYDVYIGLFMKTINGYICLNNGLVYQNTGKDFCRDLKPLINYLPKTDFAKPNYISINQANSFFNNLFNNQEKDSIYYLPNKHSINEFYIGQLHLYNEFRFKIELLNNKTYKINRIDEEIIKRSDAYQVGNEYITGIDVFKYNSLNTNYIYNYDIYQGVFMRVNDAMVFLPNNQVYTLGSMKSNYKPNKIGQSYYTGLKPLKSDEKEITVRKALTLYKNK